VLLLFLLTAMLAPSADADSAARGFAKVSIQARERLTGVRETETDPATSIRAALKACIRRLGGATREARRPSCGSSMTSS
jgi:hypothetical protein